MTETKPWGREQSSRLLSEAVDWISKENEQGRWHVELVRSIGCLGEIGGFTDLGDTCASMLRRAPDEAFTAGIITNVTDRSKLIRREPPRGDDLKDRFVRYGARTALEYAAHFNDPHISLVLSGDLEGARRNAKSELAREEFAATCAIAGHFDTALNFLETEGFPKSRVDGPVMVLCVEFFRVGDLERSSRMLERFAGRQGWHWVHLSAGFLGRVPWGGYPCPDY